MRDKLGFVGELVGALHEAPALTFPFAHGRILMRPYARINYPNKP